MKSEYPPLALHAPKILVRRRERNPWAPPNPEIIQRRAQIARAISAQLAPITKSLKGLTEPQRRALFLKLKHEGVITPQTLTGSGLKLISNPSEDQSLVVPREKDLHRFEEKLRAFAEQAIEEDKAPPAYELFSKIQSVEPGRPADRLSSELASEYKEILKKKFFIFEIEILSLETGTKKRKEDLSKTIDQITKLLGAGIHGRIYEAEFSGGSARVCLSATGAAFQKLVEDPEWQIKITSFDARPKFETFHETYENFQFGTLGKLEAPDKNAPAVCIIDSGVSAGNPFLKPVVVKHLLKSYVPGKPDPSDELGHGSGVASLAAYYALNLSAGATNTAAVRIASARIMDANGQLDDFHAASTDEHHTHQVRLLSSVLKQIVKDFKPEGIRIFVLSFSILNRIWNNDNKQRFPRTSWVARTIDQLSREEDVVFITITGNLSGTEIAEFISSTPYPRYLVEDGAQIQDPGHAVLSITVGSTAHSATVSAPLATPIADVDQPSPFTRSGPGISNCLKPEFVERGGNSVHDRSSGTVGPNVSTDVVMASNKLTPAIARDRGTSFAAPRIAYQLARIQNYLESVAIHPSAGLMKSLLANSSRLEPSIRRWLEQEISGREWTNVVGYGMPDAERAIGADEYSGLLYYDGSLKADRVALFRIPVPRELASAAAGTKRMTVSFAYAPPVQRWGFEEYLNVRAKFRVFRGDTDPNEIEAAMGREEDGENDVKDGKEDLRGHHGLIRRSRGTLQHDIFEWPVHNAQWSKHPYLIAISTSRAKWGKKDFDIPISLVVRIEDTTHSIATLNARIQQLVVPVRVRT